MKDCSNTVRNSWGLMLGLSNKKEKAPISQQSSAYPSCNSADAEEGLQLWTSQVTRLNISAPHKACRGRQITQNQRGKHESQATVFARNCSRMALRKRSCFYFSLWGFPNSSRKHHKWPRISPQKRLILIWNSIKKEKSVFWARYFESSLEEND